MTLKSLCDTLLLFITLFMLQQLIVATVDCVVVGYV